MTHDQLSLDRIKVLLKKAHPTHPDL